VLSQFDAQGQAGLKTLFAGKSLNVVYHNPKHLDYGAYQIESVQLNGQDAPFQRQGQTVILDRAIIAALPAARDKTHLLEVRLG
jgi:cellobiose phosphorylase